MTNSKKHTLKSIAELALSKGLSLKSDCYINNETKLNFQCLKCNKWLQITLQALQKNVNGCRFCYKKSTRKPKKEKVLLSKEERSNICKIAFLTRIPNKSPYSYEDAVKLFGDKGFRLLQDYFISASVSVAVECNNGHKSFKRLSDLKNYPKCKKCWYNQNSGENSASYNPNLSEKDRLNKRSKNSYWHKEVKKRDQYTCQCCFSNDKLVAHHLLSFRRYPESRYDVSNGVTLCVDCHKKFHTQYGIKNFTKENYYDFELQCQEEYYS